MKISIERLGDGPIIRPDMDARMGDNINGPSLIRAPDWLPDPLGRYYLYFGHHDGRYIRLAYADSVAGPWRMHEPGVLPLAESGFKGHIASPDVYVDDKTKQIRLYFHGADLPTANKQPQYTRVALSSDGLNFEMREEFLGRPYMRTVPYNGQFLSIAMPGIFYRSRDGLSGFEAGPSPFHEDMRHSALLVRGDRLLVFYSQIGHEPERILLSDIDLSQDWMDWRPTDPRLVLEPERDYEGGDLELRPSIRGWALEPVRELRDPAVFVEDGSHYLLYSVAGENGIALARFALSDS
ncbi:MAG: hypothetical protein AAF942_14025 [Pseudomonadota bacterium]